MYGDRILAAKRKVCLGSRLIGVTEDDKVIGRLPNAEKFARDARFAEIEENLVASEVFGRGFEGKIAEVHDFRVLPGSCRAS